MRASEGLLGAMLISARERIGGAELQLWSGPVPADLSEPATGTLLGRLKLASPAAGDPVRGVLTLYPIAEDWSADADGAAAFARVVSERGVELDLTVGTLGSGADLVITSLRIHQGGPIRVLSARLSIGCR